jgi:hypothetical protein
MKNKYIIALLVIGAVITIFGALLKILHFEIGPLTGNKILTIGVFTEIIACLLFVSKLLLNKKDDFLNK